jgi:hypothetical protein
VSQDRVTKTCPYLGLLIDPDTISAEADQINHCHLQKPPQSVDIDYQVEYCLSGKFLRCELYKNFIGESLVAADIIEGESSAINDQEDPEIKAIEEDELEQVDDHELEIENQAVLAASFAAIKGQEDEILSNKRDDDWKKKIHKEAQAQYNGASQSKPRRGLWIFLFLIAIAILAVSVYGIVNRFPTGQVSAQQGNGSGSSGSSLATAVSEMGSAADAWATAASAIEVGAAAQATNQAATSTAIAVQAQKAVEATLQATPSTVIACSNIDSTEFLIVEGPLLEPSPGYQHLLGSEPIDVEASWIVENTAACIWESVYLLSMSQASIITPTLRIEGKEINIANPDGKVLIQPDERVEIIIVYEIKEARDIDDEYVLIINGLTLINQPNLILQVDGWIKIISPASPVPSTPTPGKPTKPPSEKTPSGRPTGPAPTVRP